MENSALSARSAVRFCNRLTDFLVFIRKDLQRELWRITKANSLVIFGNFVLKLAL